LSNALSHKSVHSDKRTCLSQDLCTFGCCKLKLKGVLNYNGGERLRIEGCPLEREDIVKYKEKLETQHVTIMLLKECSRKTQMLNKGIRMERYLNKKEMDTVCRELLSTEEMHYFK